MSISCCRVVSTAFHWYICVHLKWTFSPVCVCLTLACLFSLFLALSLCFCCDISKNTISSIMTFHAAAEYLCHYVRFHQMQNHKRLLSLLLKGKVWSHTVVHTLNRWLFFFLSPAHDFPIPAHKYRLEIMCNVSKYVNIFVCSCVQYFYLKFENITFATQSLSLTASLPLFSFFCAMLNLLFSCFPFLLQFFLLSFFLFLPQFLKHQHLNLFPICLSVFSYHQSNGLAR